jgi:hypothetical protein
MRQHYDPDHQDLDDELGRPLYQGNGLSVRELTAEELQQFLDAHADQPARRLGGGWAALDPPGHPSGGPRRPPGTEPEPLRSQRSAPAEPVAGSLGSPGRSTLGQYRWRRALELAAWTRTLAWRAPLVATVGLAGTMLVSQAGLAKAPLAGLAVAALTGWRLRFRPSKQARAWQRGAAGERQTALLLDRLTRDGYVVFHDLAVPGNARANVDHLVIGPTGVFVIDSKQWTGQVLQGTDGLIWHNHSPLDRTLATVRWEAEVISRLLGTRATALVCVHGAHVQGGGLHAQGVAIVPANLLRSALGQDGVLSDGDVTALATAASISLRPAAEQS